MKYLQKGRYRLTNTVSGVRQRARGSVNEVGKGGGVVSAAGSRSEEKKEMMPWTVYTGTGQRKYLTGQEIDAFMRASRQRPADVRNFCLMLALTGCRISEGLSLTRESIDFETRTVTIKSLKKRGICVYRAVPLPAEYLKALERWLRVGAPCGQMWPWSRMTAYRRICEVMERAGVRGSHACPKGLRHGFGVRAIQASVPLTLVQRWLGHSDIKTTAIYTAASGPEERDIASRMWKGKSQPEDCDSGLNPSCDNILQNCSSSVGKGSSGGEPEPVDTRQIAGIRPQPDTLADLTAPNSDDLTAGKIRINEIATCLMIQYWLDGIRSLGFFRRLWGVGRGISKSVCR